MMIHTAQDVDHLPKRSNYRLRYRHLIMLVILTAGTIIFSATPAQAQFFNGAETWLSTAFPDVEEAIELVANIMRALLLLYLGYSLVSIIRSAQAGEDWQTIIRTPFIILASVTAADILSTIITGAGA